MIELKTCPFCGSAVDYAYNLELEPYGIHCSRCHAVVRFTRVRPIQKNEIFERVMSDIAAKWNRRQERD